MTDNNEIIEMHPTEDDRGELRYTQGRPTRKGGLLSGWIVKILGIALGFAIFLVLIFFFVYIVLPLILIVTLYLLIKNIFKIRR